MATIHCDIGRENKVITHLDKYINDSSFMSTSLGKIKINTIRLTHGDYSIEINSQICCIIERKSLDDIISTIKDKKRYDNFEKLSDHCDLYNIKKFILFESAPLDLFNQNGLSHKAIQGLLNKLQIIYNYGMIYSTDPQSSALQLITLAKSYLKYAPSIIKSDSQVTQPAINISEILNKTKKLDIESVVLNIFKYVFGILDIELYTIINSQINIIYCILMPDIIRNLNRYEQYSRKIDNLISRITNNTDTYKLAVKSIPGISEKNAELITISLKLEDWESKTLMEIESYLISIGIKKNKALLLIDVFNYLLK